ncbi:NUDIX hydrolase [Variovorax sp.]|uniref:NUDIX hydrolase n=1 Tax=Variovorax sp. TaxID=1871043 RepID=UPI002D3356B5|nr:NUDIX hydrolase [Variovorax sp.]HYP83162.1 NUDIX hydrolase [Variovorax sp.]
MTAPRWKPNVTVAAVIERDGRFLLVEEDTPAGRMLNNPAGHLEAGETPVQACAREALEETAHLFRPTGLVGIYMARARQRDGHDTTYLRMAFCGELGERVPGRELDTGILGTLWLTPEEIRASRARHRSPLLLRCVEDHLAGARHPLSLIHVDPSVLAAD